MQASLQREENKIHISDCEVNFTTFVTYGGPYGLFLQKDFLFT